MTQRKPRQEFVLPTLPKAVPYPPEAIWRMHADGDFLKFRGNTFVRRGDTIARVLDEAAASAERSAPKS